MTSSRAELDQAGLKGLRCQLEGLGTAPCGAGAPPFLGADCALGEHACWQGRAGLGFSGPRIKVSGWGSGPCVPVFPTRILKRAQSSLRRERETPPPPREVGREVSIYCDPALGRGYRPEARPPYRSLSEAVVRGGSQEAPRARQRKWP